MGANGKGNGKRDREDAPLPVEGARQKNGKSSGAHAGSEGAEREEREAAHAEAEGDAPAAAREKAEAKGASSPPVTVGGDPPHPPARPASEEHAEPPKDGPEAADAVRG